MPEWHQTIFRIDRGVQKPFISAHEMAQTRTLRVEKSQK